MAGPAVTENDNDRATALAIADAQANASIVVANAQAQSDYDSATAEIQAIATESDARVAARNTATSSLVTEILQDANDQVGVIVAETNYSTSETGQTATIEATATGQIAKTDVDATTQEAAANAGVVQSEAIQRNRADIAVANIEATASGQEATIEATAIQSEGQATILEISGDTAARVAETQGISQAEVSELSGVATIEAGVTLYSAGASASAAEVVATQDATTTTTIATTEATASIYASSRDLTATKADADSRSRINIYGADQDASASVQAATNRSQSDEHAADDRYQGVETQEDATDKRLGIKLDYAESKWGQVWPLVEESIEDPDATEPATPGLALKWPEAPARGVFTPRLIQMQANAAYASSDSSSASEYRRAQGDASGRGFGGSSPYLDALRAGLQIRAMRDANRGALTARIEAAKANADRLLEAQKLRADPAQNRIALQSQSNQIDREVGLLDGVASIVAGLI